MTETVHRFDDRGQRYVNYVISSLLFAGSDWLCQKRSGSYSVETKTLVRLDGGDSSIRMQSFSIKKNSAALNLIEVDSLNFERPPLAENYTTHHMTITFSSQPYSFLLALTPGMSPNGRGLAVNNLEHEPPKIHHATAQTLI